MIALPFFFFNDFESRDYGANHGIIFFNESTITLYYGRMIKGSRHTFVRSQKDGNENGADTIDLLPHLKTWSSELVHMFYTTQTGSLAKTLVDRASVIGKLSLFCMETAAVSTYPTGNIIFLLLTFLLLNQ